MDPLKGLALVLLLVAATAAEEQLPERFLPPRDFNPHPYQRPLSPHDPDGLQGGLQDDQPSAPSGPGAQEPVQDPVQEPHPYALLARKRPREGRYPHHQPGDPVLYPHPISVISELHRSTARAKLQRNQHRQQQQQQQQQQLQLQLQQVEGQHGQAEGAYYPVEAELQSLDPQQEVYRQPVLVYEQPAPQQDHHHQQQQLQHQQLQQQQQHAAANNYAFSYSVRDTGNGDNYAHAQARSGDGTRGEYRVRLPDGRLQIVSYVADNHGYRADVRYDEHKAAVAAHAAQPAGPVRVVPQYAPVAQLQQYVHASPSPAPEAHQYLAHVSPSAAPEQQHHQYIAVSPSPTPEQHQYVGHVSPAPEHHQYLAHVSPSPTPEQHQYIAHVSPSPTPDQHQYIAHVSPSAAPEQQQHHQYIAVSPSPTPEAHQYIAHVSPSPTPDQHQYIAHASPAPAQQHQYLAHLAPSGPEQQQYEPAQAQQFAVHRSPSETRFFSATAATPVAAATQLQYLARATAAASAAPASHQFLDRPAASSAAARQYYDDGFFVSSTTPSPLGGLDGLDGLNPSGFVEQARAAPTTQAPPPDNTASPAPIQFPRVPEDDQQQQQQQPQQQQQQQQQQQRQQQFGLSGRSNQLFQSSQRFNNILVRQGYA